MHREYAANCTVQHNLYQTLILAMSKEVCNIFDGTCLCLGYDDHNYYFMITAIKTDNDMILYNLHTLNYSIGPLIMVKSQTFNCLQLPDSL